MGLGRPMQQFDNEHRFRLERYSTPASRHICPSCGRKRKFTRYIDIEGRFVFPEHVGKCERINNCGYHYTPKQFFADNPEAKKELLSGVSDNERNVSMPIQRKPPPPPSFVRPKLMTDTMRCYGKNNFVKFLLTLYDAETVMRMIGRYHVGTSNHWDGATVFWQVDERGLVHHGKVMVYDSATGKRNKYLISTAECLMRLPDFNLQQCFFGEHLLVDKDKPVALVESEKSAIIAAEHMQQYLWLATGGSSGCLNQRMHILSDRQVVMFPDMKCLAQWQVVAHKLRQLGAKVEVSTYLEENATDEELANGLDIADFIIEERRQQRERETEPVRRTHALVARFVERYPALKMLIDKLRLEPVVDYCTQHTCYI